jgi:putative ABC transport system permease protein
MIPASYRASFGYLLRHPWQLGLAVLGIGVGVAVIVAVDLANASARKAFLLSMDAITGQATHQVIGGPRGVAETVYANLRVNHGFRRIAPVVEGAVSVDGTVLTLLGVDIFAESEIRNFSLRAGDSDLDGEPGDEAFFRNFLTEPGTVVTSRRTAGELGLVNGELFDLRVGGRSRPARLIGVFEGEDGRERLLITDIATAQEWLGTSGWLSRIDVRVEEGKAGLNALESTLPPGTRVLAAAGRTRATSDMSKAQRRLFGAATPRPDRGAEGARAHPPAVGEHAACRGRAYRPVRGGARGGVWHRAG